MEHWIIYVFVVGLVAGLISAAQARWDRVAIFIVVCFLCGLVIYFRLLGTPIL